MGIFVNASLLILGTIAIFLGISFRFKEKDLGKISFYLAGMGVMAGLWCYGFGILGMSEENSIIYVSRGMSIIAIGVYLILLTMLILYITQTPRKQAIFWTGLCTILSITDFILFCGPQGHEFVRYHGRTAYYRSSTLGGAFHQIYIAFMFLQLLTGALLWLTKAKTSYYRKMVMALVGAHFALILSIIPDTILPRLHVPSFPSSCYGIMLAYFVIWYFSVHDNILNITIENISKFAYQQANESIIVFDREGKLYAANNAACNFFHMGVPKGNRLSDLFQLEEGREEKLLKEILDEKTEEVKLRSQKGDISCSLHFTLAKDRKNRSYAIVAFVYNLTKEEKMLEELRKANAAKSDFLSNVTHEIRTPINTIIGMNEMILRESKDENIVEYASGVYRSAAMLMSIVEDVLDISKIEAGKLEIVNGDYKIIDLVNDCYNMVKDRAQAKNLCLNVHISNNLPSVWNGDVIRIKQVLINLLTNAVKYTRQGTIDFTVKEEKKQTESYLRFSVKDTGIGIKKENMDKLFAKFERLDLVHNRTIEGTGLGMNITQNLVSLMNGELSVESEYGMGSEFIVRIPQKIVDSTPANFKKQEEIIQHENKAYEPLFKAGNVRVLVVDDVEMNLKVFENLLKETEIQIDTATDGEDAINLACQKSYDMIFMDHMMPEMDGIETVKKLRENNKNMNVNTPIVMLTANALAGNDEMYRANGFAEYLTKPVNGEILEKMILKYISKDKLSEIRLSEALSESVLQKEQEQNSSEGEITVKDRIRAIKRKIPDMDIQKALAYCAGNESFYLDLLKDYCNNKNIKLAMEAYDAWDIPTYTIAVHTLKSLSRTLGLMEVGDMAEGLQKAAEQESGEYIKQNHPVFADALRNVTEIIKENLA